ncbi:hypothetical protein [Prolixibacter denitrificans]|uniref:Uncharacterized protein n=1 Tax=Prolixibacter denitrificans TaxID=1541063 RepID=A0A2P8CFT8_9BACT|nr:hypothetical protein [Prolixibacter denitrificans]PSK83759.1 hypothetical protein CLV93_103174 [Prolixibacter denitrificans]GET23302.1 hypothetical protein JCM18694_35480 [Prolixibacter denitrificans]
MNNIQKKTNGNKDMKWYGLPFIVVGLLITVTIIYTSDKKSSEIQIRINDLVNEQISGIVSSVSQNRGTITLRLKNKVNIPYYFEITRNYSLSPYDLNEFLQRGDSIYKAKNSMRLEVFRGNKSFYFILNERINQGN